MPENKRVSAISEETKLKIRRKTVFSLPDRPSEKGIKPEAIKKAMYGHVLDDSNSVISEINRIVEETNEALDDQKNDIAAKYTKPENGIPIEDLSESAQALVQSVSGTIAEVHELYDTVDEKIASKYNKPESGIPIEDLSDEVRESIRNVENSIASVQENLNDYYTKEQVNEIFAAVDNAEVIYKSISSISDTLDTDSTILDVMLAMANNSMLICDCASYPNILPDSNYSLGLLEIVKVNNNRCVARYTAKSSTVDNYARSWFGEFQVAQGGDKQWSGWQEVARVDDLQHENLLINGGFEINQRGKTEYVVDNEYTVNGWEKTTNSKVILQGGGIKLENTSSNLTAANVLLFQRYKRRVNKYVGKYFTFTVKINEILGTHFYISIRCGTATNVYITDPAVYFSQTGTFSVTVKLPQNTYYIRVQIATTKEASAGDYVILDWAKLEHGSVATSYMPRPYSEELTLCGVLITDDDVEPLKNMYNENLILNSGMTIAQMIIPAGGSKLSTTAKTAFADGNWFVGRGTVYSENGIINYCWNGTDSPNGYVQNIVDDMKDYLGKYMTLSFYLNGEYYVETFEVPSTMPSSASPLTFLSKNLTSKDKLELTMYTTSSNPYGQMQITFFTTETDIENKWLYKPKLEVGKFSTPWVPPIISTELAKCQRYYYAFNYATPAPYLVGSGFVWSATYAYVDVPIPTTMRGGVVGSLKIRDLTKLKILTNGTTKDISALDIVGKTSTSITLRATISGGTVGQTAALRIVGDYTDSQALAISCSL